MQLPDSNPKTRFGMAKPGIADIPPLAILHLGLAMTDGERKYGRTNWREHAVTASVYYNAAFRHLAAWWDGEEVAPDSLVAHLGHVMACCSILLDAMASGKLIDDRPGVPGKFGDEVKRLTKPMEPAPVPSPDLSKVEVLGTADYEWAKNLGLTEEEAVAVSRIVDDPDLAKDLEHEWEKDEKAVAAYVQMTPDEFEERLAATERDFAVAQQVEMAEATGRTWINGKDVAVPRVRADATLTKVIDLTREMIAKRPQDGIAELKLMKDHLGNQLLNVMSLSEMVRFCFYLDCRIAGIEWPHREMDDYLSREIGGEQ